VVYRLIENPINLNLQLSWKAACTYKAPEIGYAVFMNQTLLGTR